MPRRLLHAVLVAGILGSMFFVGPAAQAATARNGRCETGEFCLYYRSNNQGSLSDFSGSIPDYGLSSSSCYTFLSDGDGKGLCVRNDAASMWNRSAKKVTVFYSPNYGGPSQVVRSAEKGNLKPGLANDNASHFFGTMTATYDRPRDNPYPSAATRAPAATQRTQFVDDEIARLTGERDCAVGGYRDYQPSTSNHNSGNALDCTISDHIGVYPNSAQHDQGWRLAYWLRQWADRLDVRYVIWDGRIWSVARSSEGWRAYTTGTGVTGGHHDHVHVSMQNPYGDKMAEPDTAAG